MRLDHIAYRVKDRYKSAQFFIDCLGYRIAEDLPDGFHLHFPDGSTTDCLLLLPPEKTHVDIPWIVHPQGYEGAWDTEFHQAPEIFISDGPEGSIVGDWVKARDGVGGIHHLAYQVSDVAKVMAEWKEKGYAEFLSEEPLECPGLRQVFTKPSELTGIIYELIYRENHGFCKDNVMNLMTSTKSVNDGKD